MKKIVKLALNGLISFNLIITPAFATSTPPSVGIEERTINKLDTFLKSSKPSDVPFIDYQEQFRPDNVQPLKQINLSNFSGKKIFAGYGLYDVNQDHCKYVEAPGVDKELVSQFHVNGIFNLHSYGISKTPMSYDNCIALAAKFKSKPTAVTSASENNFVTSLWSGKEKWIGINRDSCLVPYKNTDGLTQEYFNWSPSESNECKNTELVVAQNEYGNWIKAAKTELKYCVVEVDSENILKPVKVCAPWWTIEREYANPVETTFNGVDVYKINQADIPEQFNVCLKYSAESMAAREDKPWRNVTCTSYYDSVIAPECLKNPKRPQCFVDECNGYIKNACRKTQDLTGYKDYTKAETIINNNNKVQAGKVEITTHIYSCPPSMPPLNSCEEQATVIIYPKECPNSDCDGYSTCVQNSTSFDEKATCATKHVCEKMYGNPDNTEFNSDGTLRYLKNTCSDGTVLNFEPSIQDKTSKKCIEYEKYLVEEEVTQKCTLERPYTDHIVDTSLTENDIYMNDPNCVRMNNIKDARPTVTVDFKYINKGFARTVVKKSFLDEVQQSNVNAGENWGSLDGAGTKVQNIKTPVTSGTTPSESEKDLFCRTNFTESLITTIDRLLLLKVNVSSVNYMTNGIKTNSSNKTLIEYINVPNAGTCNSIFNSTALRAIVIPSSNEYFSDTKICNIYIPFTSNIKFGLIKGEGAPQTITDTYTDESGETITETFEEFSKYTYTTLNSESKTTCDKIAYCLDGQYNKENYVVSGTAQCKVTNGENIEYEEVDTSIEELGSLIKSNADSSCRPIPTNGSYLSSLNGTQDIFSVQEVTDGAFGYYSNYSSHPYDHNIVSINGKEVYPLIKIPTINDDLVYKGEFTQKSITTKKPNILAGAIGGAAAGGAGVAMLGMVPVVGLIVLVVFVVVAMIFGKITKLNEQRYKWEIYKLVPIHRYLHNIYDYDHREILKADNKKCTQYTAGCLDGKYWLDSQNRVKLYYAHLEGFTGTLKKGPFVTMLKNLLTFKTDLIKCLGWDESSVLSLNVPMEKNIVVSHPKCKKLSWSCNKSNSETVKKVVDPFIKRMNNVYMGAVNGTSIIVPFLGDYEVKAFDSSDNLLGTILIKENEFIETTNNKAKYAQLLFGLNMNLAEGMNEGTSNNACRYDPMVEWGGGISGIYFENNNTGNSVDCQKSIDNYVKVMSAKKLSVRSLSIDREHFITLEKVQPFANRFFLVTLNEKEKREYRCYDDFTDCDPKSFVTNK